MAGLNVLATNSVIHFHLILHLSNAWPMQILPRPKSLEKQQQVQISKMIYIKIKTYVCTESRTTHHQRYSQPTSKSYSTPNWVIWIWSIPISQLHSNTYIEEEKPRNKLCNFALCSCYAICMQVICLPAPLILPSIGDNPSNNGSVRARSRLQIQSCSPKPASIPSPRLYPNGETTSSTTPSNAPPV